ncbi:glutathione S-transferase family protein [Kiloniella laminariae]|uniref:Glutathione S-transferase family protein n=1 Tax=Kiloniella laminariae TaxID=454162 RepID=A0ABT4LJQ0_9PROT|nr:glutathione S-transferase family protein [Kiloniella laminariae]MCZ4281330.1 glutathione S-transferase family protein [Kiloniella laminariae]
MILYTVPISNFGAKVQIALAVKKLEADQKLPPDGYASESYKQIIPTGTVPAIIDGDVVLSESETILEYLEERYPLPALMPKDIAARANVRMLSRFHDLKLEPSLRVLFKHMAPSIRDAGIVSEKHAEFIKHTEMLTRLGSFKPYIAGSEITFADCGFAPTFLLATKMFHVLEQSCAFPEPIQIWCEALKKNVAVSRVLETYTEAVENWVKLKLTQ